MAETKMERRHREHLEDVRWRVAYLERTRPGDSYTKDLRRSLEDLERQDRDRAAFAAEFGLAEYEWTGRNVGRLLRATGERPARVEEMWAILSSLGMGPSRSWPSPCGVFDHGTLWGRSGIPTTIVGDPYSINADAWALLAELARHPTLACAIDDRPSFYYPARIVDGARRGGTHHVRIWVREPRKPFDRGISTSKTRRAARAARAAFAEEVGA